MWFVEGMKRKERNTQATYLNFPWWFSGCRARSRSRYRYTRRRAPRCRPVPGARHRCSERRSPHRPGPTAGRCCCRRTVAVSSWRNGKRKWLFIVQKGNVNIAPPYLSVTRFLILCPRSEKPRCIGGRFCCNGCSSNVFAIGEFGSENCLSTKIGFGWLASVCGRGERKQYRDRKGVSTIELVGRQHAKHNTYFQRTTRTSCHRCDYSRCTTAFRWQWWKVWIVGMWCVRM